MNPLNRASPARPAVGRRSRRSRGRLRGVASAARMRVRGRRAAPRTRRSSRSLRERPAGSELRTEGSSLESAAAKAGNTGRAVAMSLIGLAFAVAATVLAFRRDFKEAAGVFAVGIVSVLLATPAGVNLLRDTVTSLFGSR